MSRLLIHVEGETEEEFVNELLGPHLISSGFESVSARLLGNARLRSNRGGIKGWLVVRGDIIRHLNEDAGAIATTMVDYYGLPGSGNRAWPGRAASSDLTVDAKARQVEEAIALDVATELGPAFDKARFVPFVLMHEFEGLLFSDCFKFADGVGLQSIQSELAKIRRQFETPEHINDSVLTAPSKRLETIIPGYQKPLYGNIADLAIGLDTIRAECPHFHAWLERLEQLAHR